MLQRNVQHLSDGLRMFYGEYLSRCAEIFSRPAKWFFCLLWLLYCPMADVVERGPISRTSIIARCRSPEILKTRITFSCYCTTQSYLIGQQYQATKLRSRPDPTVSEWFPRSSWRNVGCTFRPNRSPGQDQSSSSWTWGQSAWAIASFWRCRPGKWCPKCWTALFQCPK